MRIECPKCHSKYEIEDSYIPIGGAPVKCPKCGNIFGIYVEPIDIPMTPILDENINTEESLDDGREFGSSSINPEDNLQEQSEVNNQDYGNINPDVNTGESQNSFEPAMNNISETQQSSDINSEPFAQPTDNAVEQNTPDIGNPFAQPTEEPVKEQETPPAFADNPFAQPTDNAVEQNTPDIGSPFAQPTEEPVKEQETPPAFADNPFAQPTDNAVEQNTPDIGSPFAQPSEEPIKEQETPPAFADNPFAQPTDNTVEQNTPDMANPFAQPSEEPIKAQETPPAFDIPQTSQEKTEQAQPDNPFLQQSQIAEETKQETKEENPSPFVEQTPIQAPQQQPKTEEKPKEVRRVGAKLFESLLAGFTLPENYKTLPPNVQKNHKNAIKLARQLVKDILLYHKDIVEQGLANGNIKELLADEIEKSYKFYQQRIQPEIVQNTNYFNEALNKILAKGQKIF